MILLELKHYISKHKKVPADNLMRHFDLSKDALDGLVKPLLQQGYIYRQTSTDQACTKTCQSSCRAQTSHDYFYWSAHPLKPLSIEVSVKA